MRSIRLPSDCQARAPRQHEYHPARPRDPTHLFVTRAALGRGVMAKDHPGPARQPLQRRIQPGIGALVGHQPQGRQRLAAAHRLFYSAPVPSAEISPSERLAAVRAAIAHNAGLARRDPADIELIAISKTHPPEAIAPLIAAGQRSFGENRVQEAQAKWPTLKAETADIHLHLVGQLQSNKADDAVALFDAIHSVDRPSLVTALARAIQAQGRAPDCYIQVNIGEEAQKGGCAIADLPALLHTARDAGLPIVGLMAVPPADTEPAPYFALLAKLARNHGLTQLSMGMSGDYETAVLLGATCVRVGSALFGERG